jgi:rhomboid-like protein
MDEKTESDIRIRLSSSVVRSIIKLNILVFLAWNFTGPRFQDLMMENFVVSWQYLEHGRIWTLLTAVFSHINLLHLMVNMYALYGFGVILESLLGRKRFLIFYLSAGAFSSLTHALVSAWILHRPEIPALGASGAVSGVLIVFCALFPYEKILLLGIIPLPAFFGALLFIGLDIWGLVAQSHGGGLPIGHGAHLGGALAGFFYYLFFLRQSIHRHPDIR